MTRLTCFTGLPGVGKSTISHATSSRAGAAIIDIDEFKKIHVDPRLVRTQIDPPELRWAYYCDSVAYAFDLFDQGAENAILDEVFHLHSLRMRVEDMCSKRGVNVLWVEVQCPHDIVKKRLAAKERGGHILSTDEALRMNLLFQEIYETFPAQIENHILVRNDDTHDIRSTTDEILRKMG